ncbi:MAG: restriction endonuclease subunit S [Leptothrix sp. (in: Bacteria)]|nr:restriction endonuclease subunit S [Leptothrix sp. (in: b-proteobacteria)]
MTHWQQLPLGKIADLSLGKMLDEKKNRGDLLPYLANINVRWGEFDLANLRQMRFEPGELERFGLRLGDIVMCEGGEPGRCAIWTDALPGMMFQKAIHRIRPFDFIDHRFLFYSFLQMGRTGGFAQLFTGATIKHLPLQSLAKVEVLFPTRAEQECISNVLIAYDDLIENNRRRMALLEESARLLYNEWFVRLRFPGHEHTPIVDGVPQGWAKTRVGDLGTVVTGKTPSTKEAENYGGDVFFVKTPDMHGNPFVIQTESHLTEKGSSMQAGKLLPAGALLVSCIGTIGVVSITSAPSQFNQQINAIVPCRDELRYFCYFALKDLKPRMEAIGGGVTMANVSKGKFEELDVLRPTDQLMRGFDEFCQPVFTQIKTLMQQNQKLRAARDLLLPRLMSGDFIA